jgi:integrase
VFPYLGSKFVGEITAPELLTCLRRVEARGANVLAHRALSSLSRVFAFAIGTSRATRNPAVDIRGVLTPTTQARHHAAITEPKAVGGLLRSIDSYEGSVITRCALKLAALTFVRPGELRKAEWSEVNFDAAEWRIPATKMKMRQLHIVPLSHQAVAILREIQPLTGSGKYIFPGLHRRGRPMSCNTLNSALRRMGYTEDEMTSHGFRSVASTLLHGAGWNSDMIERQLAHADRDKVRAAYSHAQFLPERRKMMSWWSDYLDKLRQGVVVGEGDQPVHTMTGLSIYGA